MAWDYSELLREHFLNPRNVLDEDESTYEADGVGDVGNAMCGDMMKIWIRVDDAGVITECKWKTYGCASAIGTTSMLSEMVIGMKLADALRITPDDIAKALGGVPAQKFHCSVMGDKALRHAAKDYCKRKGIPYMGPSEKEHVVCECLDVSADEIRAAVAEGADSFLALQQMTKAGTGCGKCRDEIKKLLSEYLAAKAEGKL